MLEFRNQIRQIVEFQVKGAFNIPVSVELIFYFVGDKTPALYHLTRNMCQALSPSLISHYTLIKEVNAKIVTGDQNPRTEIIVRQILGETTVSK